MTSYSHTVAGSEQEERKVEKGKNEDKILSWFGATISYVYTADEILFIESDYKMYKALQVRNQPHHVLNLSMTLRLHIINIKHLTKSYISYPIPICKFSYNDFIPTN